MKTKQFNLEEALAGAKVVTRDGDEVTQLHKFDATEKHPLCGVLDGQIQSWTINGNYWDSGEPHYRDLFIAVEPERMWTNLYRSVHETLYVYGNYKTKENALEYKDRFPCYIKTIEITDEL